MMMARRSLSSYHSSKKQIKNRKGKERKGKEREGKEMKGEKEGR